MSAIELKNDLLMAQEGLKIKVKEKLKAEEVDSYDSYDNYDYDLMDFKLKNEEVSFLLIYFADFFSVFRRF